MTMNPREVCEHKLLLDQVTHNLVAAERRAKTLAELNRLLAHGWDPLELAQYAVDLVMRATGASGSFVYLWDPGTERLVLRVATTGRQSAHVGQVHLRLGEGVTGWAALMRQTVVIQDDISQDPRSISFPFLDEDRFRSMVSVPTVAGGSELMGTFNVVSVHPGAFDSHDIDLATEVGRLLASGLVQAKTIEDLRRQSAAARFLMTVPPDATSSLQRCIDVLAGSIREQVGALLCTIELAERDSVAGPIRPGIAFAPDVDHALIVLGRSVRSRAELTALVRELDTDKEKFATSFGPLVPLGVVTCYRSQAFTDNDTRIIEALSTQSAALIASVTNSVATTPLAGRLCAPPTLDLVERALLELGWRPGPTHPIILRMPASQFRSNASFDRIVDALRKVCDSFEGVVIVPSAPTVTLLVRHQPDQWPTFLQTLRLAIKSLPSDSQQPLSVGVGPLAADPLDIRDNLAHAETALVWAELLGETAVQYDDIAHLLNVPSAIVNTGPALREALLRMREIARYDLRYGTELSHTLDTYISNGRSMTDTAEKLFIHRNTLRQRLARIEDVMGQPIAPTDDWTAFAVAARLNAARGGILHIGPSGPRLG
ncbi:helix-turn-helix domain-containing protein [Mycobacterium sp. smrl_JER01]|uniref:helix-turn-helix domain-containing protein n=1 Tax=Mycobacterium sp. smrl_JER01 TaxID=3402633 RepID=UPI003ABF6453